MRIVIDLDLCGGFGVCQEKAPEVLRVVDDADGFAHAEVLLDDPTAAQMETVHEAIRLCPTRAITIEDD